jgi:retron-type reverse transcriptase
MDWPSIRRSVRRLQCRIAQAVKDGRWNKVKALPHLLTRSLAAKCLAVRRVTTSKGRKTPGVDGVVWRGARVKGQATQSLRRRGYQPQPLRRIYIPKKSGTKKRPLSIPTMYDRAMQALYKLALAPVAETTADPNSYGFREGRRCADATAAGFNALAKPNSAPWILDADIQGCFDNIRHDWMIDNIPTDERGLQLSDEKTAITHIKHGFEFLGQCFRKRAGTLHITPSSDSVTALLRKLGTLIRNHVSAPMPALVKQLNQALRGWGNYHRHVVAGDAFSRVNLYVYRQLWRMLRRRHPGKSRKWLSRTCWDTTGPARIFVAAARTRKGESTYPVVRLTSTNSQRYVKVRANANPYRPADAAYFRRRRHDSEATGRTLA